MKLLTKALRERLLKNGRNRDQDHAPPLKVFNPTGAATWLFSELDEDGDTLWGLADISVSAAPLSSATRRLCRARRIPRPIRSRH